MSFDPAPPLNEGDMITNGLQAGTVRGDTVFDDAVALDMARVWGMNAPEPELQRFTRFALRGWRKVATEWTAHTTDDGEQIEEKWRRFDDSHSPGGFVMRRYVRPVPVTLDAQPAAPAAGLRGTCTRWTRERNQRALSADILGDVEIIVDLPNGRVITDIPCRPLSPDEARMIGVRLIEAACLADGERAVRDRS